MDLEKFTHMTNETLVGAHELVSTLGHAQITPLYLSSILIFDPTNIFFQSISNVGGEVSECVIERVIKQSMKKLPSQSYPPEDAPGSTYLIKFIRRAKAEQNSLLVDIGNS
ncbi:unnamed protein product [Lathyrus sativus]|nr:unnamed protein product [Lathyrus sativus]